MILATELVEFLNNSKLERCFAENGLFIGYHDKFLQIYNKMDEENLIEVNLNSIQNIQQSLLKVSETNNTEMLKYTEIHYEISIATRLAHKGALGGFEHFDYRMNAHHIIHSDIADLNEEIRNAIFKQITDRN